GIAVGIGILFVRLFRLGAQGGLVRSGVLHFLGEHDVAQAGFDGVEFRRGHDVFLFGRQNTRDFLLRVFDAFGVRRMRRENLGDGTWAALLICLNALKKGYVGVRVVA